MFSFVDLMMNLCALYKVVISSEAPLELIAFPTLNFQKRDDLLKTSSSGILVSSMSKMSGFSVFIMFFRASTLTDPPRPLQFQDTRFIIS